MGTLSNPKWWSAEHQSTWERVKAAFRRDWEQTKSDVSDQGTDLNQNAADTVKQAVGAEPIPSATTQTRPETTQLHGTDWDNVEPAYRYGYAARQQYQDDNDWNDRLEGKLKEEWTDLKSGRTWDEMKAAVQNGWEKAKPGKDAPR